MAALTASFDAPQRPGEIQQVPAKAATKFFAGGIIAIDATGWAVPAADTAGLDVIGRCEKDVDNSAGANGDLNVPVRRGCFRWNNSGTNTLTKAHVGRTVFAEDDNTVASTTTNKIVVGTLQEVDSVGAWVDTLHAPTAARTVTLTSTDGTAAAASANLANLAAEAEKIGDDVRALHAALKLQGLIA